MKYDKIINEKLELLKDDKYAKFHSALVPNIKILGVKVPNLRKIAKEFSIYNDFIYNLSLNSYENISIACYYIGITSKNIPTLIENLNYILPYIDNWAVCDTFVSSLKCLKSDKNKNDFLPYLTKCLNSGKIYTIRFAIVCLLSYFITIENVNNILIKMLDLQNIDYYIDMAIAWLVSISFIKCRDTTLLFLQKKKFNKFVQNKSISKICDSFRVSSEDKLLVKSYLI